MGTGGGSNGFQVHKGNSPGTITFQPLDDSSDYSVCKVHAVYPWPIAWCHSVGTGSAAVLSSGRSRSFSLQTRVSQNYTDLF